MMNESVQVVVAEGRSLRAPDGRIIGAGETVAVSAHEAAFFARMGAARIVATRPDDLPAPKAAAKPKAKE